MLRLVCISVTVMRSRESRDIERATSPSAPAIDEIPSPISATDTKESSATPEMGKAPITIFTWLGA
ncbi:hypothetical protein D3C87_2148870 [compost metagenome]